MKTYIASEVLRTYQFKKTSKVFTFDNIKFNKEYDRVFQENNNGCTNSFSNILISPYMIRDYTRWYTY